MTLSRYVAGVGLLMLVIAPLAYAAFRLRSRWFAGWTGPLARLAEVVLICAGLLTVAIALGSVGAFAPAPVVICCVMSGIAAEWVCRRPRVASHVGPPPAPRPSYLAVAAASAAVAVLLLHWVQPTITTLHEGMHYFDSLAYHMPIAVRLTDGGSFLALFSVEQDPLTGSYPANAEALHALGMLLFDRDLLSPLMNDVWLGVALLAAWCIGRPRGLGPQAILAVAVVLASPVMVTTAPGEATNDVMGIALLLAAVALVVNSERQTAPLALAGVAAGLAIGTRLTLIFPAVALCVGVTLATRRRDAPAAFAVPFVLFGAFWFLRDLIAVGNPLPGLDLPFGVPYIDSLYLHADNTARLAEYVWRADFLRDVFVPGSRLAFGHWWPAIFSAGVLGAIGALLPGRPWTRMLGGVALASMVAYAFTPATAAAGGDSLILFGVNLRYVLPGLTLGLVLLPLSPLVDSPRRQRVVLFVLALLFVASATAWVPPSLRVNTRSAAGVEAVVILLGAGLWLVHRGKVPRSAAAAGGLAVALVAIAVGWHETKVNVSHRYRDSTFAVWRYLVPVYRWADTVEGARIGFVKLHLTYPLSGATLSNHVEPIGVKEPHGNFRKAASCREWRATLRRGRYEYVVVAPPDFPDVDPGGAPPEADWTRSIPGARMLYHQPRDRVSVFALTRPIRRADCTG